MGRPRPLPARLVRRALADDGFSVIEAVVALMILGLVSSGFTYGMNMSLQVTRDVRLRQQATHLAEREIEIARNEFRHLTEDQQTALLDVGETANRNPIGAARRTTDGPDLVVDGRKFRVVRRNALVLDGQGKSPCDGSAATVDYMSMGVHISVSWTDGGNVHTVDNDTVLTPTKGVNPSMGFVAIKLEDASGKGTPNVFLQVSGPGGTQTKSTAADGCAVFRFTQAGSYTATTNGDTTGDGVNDGYINPDGLSSVSTLVSMTLGTVTVAKVPFTKLTTIHADYLTAPGHALPNPLPHLTLSNSGLNNVNARIHRPAAGDPTTLSPLWPFVDGYSVWAGTCTQSDPGTILLDATTYYQRPTKTIGPAGGSATASVYLQPVTLRTMTAAGVDEFGEPTGVPGVPVGGLELVATPMVADGCQSGDPIPLVLGVTDANGELKTSLPSGSWQIAPGEAAPFTCGAAGTCPASVGPVVAVSADGEAPDLTPLVVPDLEVAPVVVVPEEVTP